MIECWAGPSQNFGVPRALEWEFKSDTDLYCLMGAQTHALNMTCTTDGKTLAILAADRKVSANSAYALWSITCVVSPVRKMLEDCQFFVASVPIFS